MSFTMFVSRTSASCSRGVAVTGQIVGIIANLPFVVLALMVGLIGLTHGTDTSVRENNILAISGLSFAAIGIITCSALLVSQRPLFRVLFVTAGVANGAMLVVALYHVTIGASEPDNIQNASIFYGLAFFSVNAIAVRAAYLRRSCGW